MPMDTYLALTGGFAPRGGGGTEEEFRGFSDEQITGLAGFGKPEPSKMTFAESFFTDPETGQRFEWTPEGVIHTPRKRTVIDVDPESAGRAGVPLLGPLVGIGGTTAADVRALAPKGGGFAKSTIRQEGIEGQAEPSEAEFNRAREHFVKLMARRQTDEAETDRFLGPARNAARAMREAGFSKKEIAARIMQKGEQEREPERLAARRQQPEEAAAITGAREAAKAPFRAKAKAETAEEKRVGLVEKRVYDLAKEQSKTLFKRLREGLKEDQKSLEEGAFRVRGETVEKTKQKRSSLEGRIKSRAAEIEALEEEMPAILGDLATGEISAEEFRKAITERLAKIVRGK